MYAILSNAMAAWLLLLAVSGWCCHFPMDGTAKPSQSQPVACCKHCQRHRCEHQSGQGNRPDAPRPSQSDCHGVCVYLPPQEMQVELASMSWDAAAIVPVLGTSQLDTASSWERLCEPSGSEPPMRLHHLHQIMLI
jgi:hypothetical protein